MLTKKQCKNWVYKRGCKKGHKICMIKRYPDLKCFERKFPLPSFSNISIEGL